MFIAIVGTRCSGKNTVKDYLVSKGFEWVALTDQGIDKWYAKRAEEGQHSKHASSDGTPPPMQSHVSPPQKHSIEAPGMKPPLSYYITISDNSESSSSKKKPQSFASPSDLHDFVTEHWQDNFVTMDLITKELVEYFMRRPFFLLVSVDAPLSRRYYRSIGMGLDKPLDWFVMENDGNTFGTFGLDAQELHGQQIRTTALRSFRHLVNVHVANVFDSITVLYSHLDDIDLLNPERLRPSWDTYFMMLASLASHRSNCMKRRVGAVLVRENRIVSTGYNGTPRWLKNCNEGGCGICNGTSPSDENRECICLHAEENAISEAGRERVGIGSVLYCNTCPCERCTIKIIQSGVKEVVYNLEYKVDQHSAALFKEANVILRKHALPIEV